jgi:hypothetical protein
MHLVRLDIDKKNSASQYQVGPLGGGLNAVYSPISTASSLLTRFVRNVLFHGQSFSELEDSEFDAIDGSMTWVDASGHLRMISCSGGAPIIPSRYVHSPLHPSDHPIYEDDVARVRGIGNLFWEGDEEDGRWDDMRSDLLAMVFCMPLGSISPEKLWWAASRLGVHATARTQLDEGYKHLKDEEQQLLARLRDGESVDHDRSWWTMERDRLQAELSYVAHQRAAHVSVHGNDNPWDDSQLRQQLAHAEEMIRRWDRRSQWHRRLAEVQSHLKTRSPYRRTAEGSLIPMAEKFLKELTAGAVRQLPPWAIEASYLQEAGTTGPQDSGLHASSEDPRMHGPWMDRTVPSPNTRQRRLVDLAIRLAIATNASARIGRIPMVLEQSLDGFRGEPLEQLLHVLAGVSRDGRQILVTTQDEFVARRIVAHGGTVARVHENLRYAKPQYVIDSDTDLGIHPVLDRAPVVRYGVGASAVDNAHELREINKQLASIADENQQDAWWNPAASPASASVQPVVYTVGGKTYYLSMDSSVDQVPGIGFDAAGRLRSVGVHRVIDLVQMAPQRVAMVAGLERGAVRRVLSIIDLMCHTPQLRAFDAKVLVACGIATASELKQVRASQLAQQVEELLASEKGSSLLRSATETELARLRSWMASIRGGSERNSWNSTGEFHRPIVRRKRLRRTKPGNGSKDLQRSQRDAAPSVAVPVMKRQFHLELSSPVVDAPTIGTRMAEKLHAIHVVTVGDLVGADAAEIADNLAEKNVTALTVEEWQQQAMLVCRIPNLRGQDAQLLVAAGYVTAELVAATDPETLYAAISQAAQSKRGTRFLRGGNPPDRSQVSQWVVWAQRSRSVRAA